MTRKHISVIETAINRPSLDTLVDIANALNVSADDLLVDSLTHSASTADSEIHRLLLDCNTPIYLRITLSTRNSFACSMSRFRSLFLLETYVFRTELKSCASILLRLLIRSQIVRSKSYIGIMFPSLSFTMIFPTSSNSRFTLYTLQLPSAHCNRCIW